MKSILLASASIVGFAGIAHAEAHTGVGFAGSATLGYNDDIEDGIYWDAELAVTMTAALDNGVTAQATYTLEIVDGTIAENVDASDFVIAVTSDMGGLFFGDVDPVADDIWSGVDGSEVPDFNDQDVHFDVALFDAILRGELMFGGFTGYVSYGVDTDGDTIEDDVDALQLAATGDFGAYSFIIAYQEEFGPTPTIFAVSGSTSLAGADIQVAYENADDAADSSSLGASVSYPLGAVTLTGYYTINMEDADIDNDGFGVSADYVSGPIAVNAFYDGSTEDGNDGEFGVEGSYDVGNGVLFFAGYINDLSLDDDAAEYYAAATVDLGGGASLLLSYADDEDDADDNDEIGDPEYMSGITLEATFEF